MHNIQPIYTPSLLCSFDFILMVSRDFTSTCIFAACTQSFDFILIHTKRFYYYSFSAVVLKSFDYILMVPSDSTSTCILAVCTQSFDFILMVPRDSPSTHIVGLILQLYCFWCKAEQLKSNNNLSGITSMEMDNLLYIQVCKDVYSSYCTQKL